MAYFRYSAVTHGGDLVRGDAEFLDVGELIESLRGRKLTLHRATALPNWLVTLRAGKLGPQPTAEFCYFLAEYTRAGAELRLALQGMTESAPSVRVRNLSRSLLTRIERGDTLSAAMRHTRAFPSLMTNLARVGEETGRLDMTLTAASRHYEQVVQMRSGMQRALMYPALALVMLLGAAAFWVGYVLPQLAVLFQSMMPQLPASTRAVLDGATWLRTYWPSVVTGMALLFVGFPLLLMRPAMRPVTDWLKWHAPALARLERARTAYLFFANLAVMYGAGMTLTRALDVLVAEPGNSRFGRKLAGLAERIVRGGSLSQAMVAARTFEPIAVGMIRLGESTGSLAGQSQRLGEFYQQKFRAQTEFLMRLVEPMVLLAIGVLLILVVVTIVSPIYELAQQAVGGVRR